MADIGGREELSLEVGIGFDTFFDLEWYQDEAETVPEVIVDCFGAIKTSTLPDADLVLDLTPLMSVDGHIVKVRITSEVSAALEAAQHLAYDIAIEGGAANDKRVAIGGPCDVVLRAAI